MKPLKNLPEVLKAVGNKQLDADEVADIIKAAILERKQEPSIMIHFEVDYLGYGYDATCSADFKTPAEVREYRDSGGKWIYYPIAIWMSGQ